MQLAVNTCKDLLEPIGYSSGYFSNNYIVQVDGNTAVKFDSVAFCDANKQDASTSCISIKSITNTDDQSLIFQAAKYVATPIVLLENKGEYQLWNVKADSKKDTSNLIKGTSRELQDYLNKNRVSFLPETIKRAKYEFHQVTVFEAFGLIDISHKATQKILSEEFLEGLIVAKRVLREECKLNQSNLNKATSIVMHVISAQIIGCKLFDNDEVWPFRELIHELSKMFPSYFKQSVIYAFGIDFVEKIYDALNHTINYKYVDHELLGSFYESSLFQTDPKTANNIRKQFGIYYTPRYLSDLIANAIPFEEIIEEKRTVFDGSCGSGTLLVSATKRLEDLLPKKCKDEEKHAYLVSHISGKDIDVFATEVSRLSLLLYSLPYNDNWNIVSDDFLNNDMVDKPSIIMGNPPFEEKYQGGKRQKAADFCLKYMKLLDEDGYLGIVLPETFLQNESCKDAREYLIKCFDILELWNLPGTIFDNNASTIVIIGKKSRKKSNLVQIRSLTKNKNSIKRFKTSQVWDFEYCVNYSSKWEKDPNYKIQYSFAQPILDKMNYMGRCIRDVCVTYQGLKIPKIDRKHGTDFRVKYIANAFNFQAYYVEKPVIELIDYCALRTLESTKPEKGIRTRWQHKSELQERFKIIIKKNSTPGVLGNIAAAIEDRGFYPGDSFDVLNIKQGCSIDLYVLCAWLNSTFVQVYCRSMKVNRTIDTDLINSIPVPEFSEYATTKIRDLLKHEKHPSLNTRECIDSIFAEELGLTDADRNIIKTYVDTYKGEAYIQPNCKPENVSFVYGIVDHVDEYNMTISVYINETGEVLLIPINKNMPGWLLREGVEFKAQCAYGKYYDFRLLRGNSLSVDDIYKCLENMFDKV